MQIKSASFATMVAGNDLVIGNRVTLALDDAPQFSDVTIACESIQVERQMTTDAPAATRLISGYPAASATVVLSGLLDVTDGTTGAFDVLNPYNPASPIYRDLIVGAAVTIEAGLWVGDATPELVTQFTGTVDTYDLDPLAGTVTLHCLDGRNQLRSVPAQSTIVCDPMPAVTTYVAGSLFSETTSPGLTSVYPIESLLRANGIYASPPQRAGALVFASMAGGGFPQTYNVATLPTWCDPSRYSGLLDDSPMQMVPGYWSGQVCRDVSLVASCYPNAGQAPASAASGSGGYYWQSMLDFTELIDWYSGNLTIPPAIQVSGRAEINSGVGDLSLYHHTWTLTPVLNAALQPDGSHAWNLVTDAGTNVPGTITPGWHQVGVQVTFNAGGTCTYTVWLDGAALITYTEASPGHAGNFTRVIFTSHLPVEHLQFTGETAAAPDDVTAFTPTAVLDASLNKLHAVCDMRGGDPWTIMQELAGAELAVCGFDELNTFRFTNRDTLRRGLPVRTIHSRHSLAALTMTAQSASAVNRVVVPISGITLGEFQAIYSGPDPSTAFFLPAHTSYANGVQTQQPFTGLSTYVQAGLYPQQSVPLPALDNGSAASGWRADKGPAGMLPAITAGLGMVAYQQDPSTIVFTLSNANNYPAYLVTPTGHGYTDAVGSPFFVIGGCPVYFGQSAQGTATPTTGAVTPAAAGAAVATEVPSANAQWVQGGAREHALQFPTNRWVQDADVAQQLAEDILEDLIYPRPIWQGTQIVADPRLQLADRVTVIDPDASLIADDAILFGSSLAISATAWDQAVDLRTINQPGYWVLGSTGHSELGLTTYV